MEKLIQNSVTLMVISRTGSSKSVSSTGKTLSSPYTQPTSSGPPGEQLRLYYYSKRTQLFDISTEDMNPEMRRRVGMDAMSFVFDERTNDDG